MGADQIGFLFKGLAKLDRSKKTVRAARERATEVYRALKRLRQIEQLPAKRPPELRHLCRGEVEDVLGEIGTLPKPRVAVSNLLDWWSGGSRDTCTRADPDARGQVIGFAGDRSWGDAPDGFGYCTFKAALVLDILAVFGIR